MSTIEVMDETRAGVGRLVSSGAFATADAVVAAGLRLLDERRAVADRLTAAIDDGLAESDRGEGLDGQAVFREVFARIDVAEAEGRGGGA